jgi:hypothetical protein
MAKVNFVKAARKDYQEHGIKKGEPYYHWSFRFGGKRISKIKPKPSQLTNSPFTSELYAIQEEIADAAPADKDSLKDMVDDWAGRARELGEQSQESFDNMPEGLQQGDTGQMLEERANAMSQWADDLEGVDLDDEDCELDDMLEQIKQMDCGI